MSIRARTIKYGVAAAVLAIAIIAASSFFVNTSLSPGLASTMSQPSQASTSPSQPSQVSTVSSQASQVSTSLTQPSQVSTSEAQSGSTSLLVIQLTDPPSVPAGTIWLNLTYSSLALLVGEPTGSGGQISTKTLTITPGGGLATLDLLGLQNVTQTIASASLPDGSVIYSVTFTVHSIYIDVDGTVSPVYLAVDGNTFTVTMANVPVLHGTNLALLELNPVVVNSPDGYTLIPSAVGVLRQSEGQGESTIGWRNPLSGNDGKSLKSARGSLSANLLSLSVSGSTTTLTVQVTNTGTTPVNLQAIGMTGPFNTQGGGCGTGTTTTTTTTTETTTGRYQPWTNFPTGNWQTFACWMTKHWNVVAFVPVLPTTSTTTTTTTKTTVSSGACGGGELALLSRQFSGRFDGLSISPGQCVNLTFSGTISFGDVGITIVPTTTAGTVYHLYVMATNGASLGLACTLGKTISCTTQEIPMQWK